MQKFKCILWLSFAKQKVTRMRLTAQPLVRRLGVLAKGRLVRLPGEGGVGVAAVVDGQDVEIQTLENLVQLSTVVLRSGGKFWTKK
jgi:hypothetical protein